MNAEYEHLTTKVAVINVAVERQICVKGPDAEDFVNMVITRNARLIKPQTCKYVILGPSFAFESLSQLANEDEDFAELEKPAQQQVGSAHTRTHANISANEYISTASPTISPALPYTPAIAVRILHHLRSCAGWARSSRSTNTSR